MSTDPTFKETIKKIKRRELFIVGIFLFLFSLELYPQSSIFAQESEELSKLEEQARIYHQQAQALQEIGNLKGAITFYQKTMMLDPSYVFAYNDLGVVYESIGEVDAAQEIYLKATEVNPDYLSPYSNLALLLEEKGDIEGALFYWEKRGRLGSADDPWTQKAIVRVKDICAYLGIPNRLEAYDWMEELTTQRTPLPEDNQELAALYFRKAKLKYKEGDLLLALKEAINAQQLDPANPEIEEFIEKVQIRLLLR